MSYSALGKIWTPASLASELGQIQRPAWVESICLHHTAMPNLGIRPKGILAQHMVNIRDFYRDTNGWKSGPHLFTDEDQIFGLTPLSEKGIHAKSFNSRAIGIEALGDFDSEDPTTGRGLQVWQTTCATAAVLLRWLGLPPGKNTILFHRDDPKTTKSCPGVMVGKTWILNMIEGFLSAPASPGPAENDPKPELPAGKEWDRWKRLSNFWAVPVASFLNEIRGVPWDTIKAKLHKEEEGFHYGAELLEGAAFVDGETWGSAQELLTLELSKL